MNVLVRAGDGMGTGFFVAPGMVVTCLHVVFGAEEISVQMHHGGVLHVSLVEVYDRVNDIAVLRVDSKMPPPFQSLIPTACGLAMTCW